LIDNITHVFEFFRTLDQVLKDKLGTKWPKSQLVPLVEPIDTTCEWFVDTTCEQHVDDLVASLNKWFQVIDFKEKI
jgi:hypothetical protein